MMPTLVDNNNSSKTMIHHHSIQNLCAITIQGITMLFHFTKLPHNIKKYHPFLLVLKILPDLFIMRIFDNIVSQKMMAIVLFLRCY